MLIKGGHRWVWIVGPLVFKFPRIWKMLLNIYFSILEAHMVSKIERTIDENGRFINEKQLRGSKRLSRFYVKACQCAKQSISSSGFMENWREAKAYLSTKNRLLARLYLPLIIVNVFKRYDGVGRIDLDAEEKVCGALLKIFGNELKKTRYCLHTFCFAGNFSFDGNQLHILDYGEFGFQALLEKFDDKIESLLLEYVIK